MRYLFTAEDEAFRSEVREFLRRELGSDWTGSVTELQPDEFDFDIHMRRRLAEKGWLTQAWPKEYGGEGASVSRQMVLNEEIGYHRSPGKDGQGIVMIGPCIMIHGTQEQKKEHLPRIAGGEVVWCQGFSEPGSGSDLASLQTRAVRDGDDYVINGSKVWTTHAHRSDWMHVLTRTLPDAPKHRGISYFLLDMKTPGIEVRPLINMGGGHGFNQVFFNDVRVPAQNMLGPENRGWYVATTTLDFERTAVGISAAMQRMLDDAVAYLRGLDREGKSPAKSPVVRNKLAERAIDINVARLHSYRIGWMQSQGNVPNAEASMARMFSTELTQRMAATLMEIIGVPGQDRSQLRRAGFPALVCQFYLHSVSNTIAGGTREIQRNIVATRGLGLPR